MSVLLALCQLAPPDSIGTKFTPEILQGKVAQEATRHFKRKMTTSIGTIANAKLSCSALLLANLHQKLPYVARANPCRREGVFGISREQPFTGFVSALLLQQVLHGAADYSLVQTSIGIPLCNRRVGLVFIRKGCHCILPKAVGTGLQPGQNCVLDPRKRTSKTPQPSQNLSSRALITSQECRDSL